MKVIPAPSLVPVYPAPSKTKEVDSELKSAESNSLQVKWVQRSFNSKAHLGTEHVVNLKSWTRTLVDTQQDCIVAEEQGIEKVLGQWNQKVFIPTYNNIEYEYYLADTEWTQEETDYLMQLCSDYDMRFPVILDRYNFNGQTRSMEELKDRVYSIFRKMHRLSPQLEDFEYKHYDYNKNRETERRKNLQRILDRNLSIVQDEEFLLVESKRIESTRKRLEIQREALFRVLNGGFDYNSGVTSLRLENRAIPLETSIGYIRSNEAPPPGTGRRMKKKRAYSNANAAAASSSTNATSSANATGSSPAILPANSSVTLAESASLDSLMTDPMGAPFGGTTRKERVPNGPYVRSSRLTPIKPVWTKQVERIFQELGIAPKPTVPTAAVMEKYDELRIRIVSLLEWRKQTEKVEHEHARSLASPTSPHMKHSHSGSGSNLDSKEDLQTNLPVAHKARRRSQLHIVNDD